MADWFDLEAVRASTGRLVVVRTVTEPTVVIGSTQPDTVIVPGTLPVVRRRSGGGAVLVTPQDPLWIDVWVPRDDPLWQPDVGRAAAWVGEWWATTLSALGAPPLSVHRGGLTGGPWSGAVCFAGVGPGEVVAGGRKVVGLAQWRGREGALFHTAAYRRWDPESLVAVLDLQPDDRRAVRAAVARAAVGLSELLDPGVDDDRLLTELMAHLPVGHWGHSTD